MENCPRCNSEIQENIEFCPTCREYIAPPNIRIVGREEEKNALHERYEAALKASRSKGAHDSLRSFETAVKNSFAVVNDNLAKLYSFFANNNQTYSTYTNQTKSGSRVLASIDNDRDRTMADSAIFGSIGGDIRHASLSLNGSGLKSYGDFAMKLKNIAIKDRATLLEENSYFFASKHGIHVGVPVPSGYRALWDQKHKLAVAKLADKLLPDTSPEDYAKILLHSGVNRKADDYIEVHIYGPYDNNAIDFVKGKSNRKNKHESAIIEFVKDCLAANGQQWIEE